MPCPAPTTNWVTEFCSTDPRRLKAIAMLALHDVDDAVTEMKRGTQEMGHVAAMLATNIKGKDLNHPDFLPLFAETEKLNIPLCVHGARAIVKSCVWVCHAAARSWRSPFTNLTPRMISAN